MSSRPLFTISCIAGRSAESSPGVSVTCTSYCGNTVVRTTVANVTSPAVSTIFPPVAEGQVTQTTGTALTATSNTTPVQLGQLAATQYIVAGDLAGGIDDSEVAALVRRQR